MDKVKLIDAVSRGSHARNTVDPELIIGDASNGYDQGDILDANSVQEKVEDIQETIDGLDNVYAPKVENGYIENPDIDGVSGQILSLDSQGNTVWSNPTEGSVTDSTMSDISENPVQNKTIKAYVDSTIYDISVNHPTSGVDDGNTYTSLSEALAVIPQDKQKGGMTVRYIQSSDNKYVQYRLMSNSFNTTPANWQGVDAEPTAGSENLVKSGGINKTFNNSFYPKKVINVLSLAKAVLQYDGVHAIITVSDGLFSVKYFQAEYSGEYTFITQGITGTINVPRLYYIHQIAIFDSEPQVGSVPSSYFTKQSYEIGNPIITRLNVTAGQYIAFTSISDMNMSLFTNVGGINYLFDELDDVPTIGSENPVKSNGLFEQLNIQDYEDSVNILNVNLVRPGNYLIQAGVPYGLVEMPSSYGYCRITKPIEIPATEELLYYKGLRGYNGTPVKARFSTDNTDAGGSVVLYQLPNTTVEGATGSIPIGDYYRQGYRYIIIELFREAGDPFPSYDDIILTYDPFKSLKDAVSDMANEINNAEVMNGRFVAYENRATKFPNTSPRKPCVVFQYDVGFNDTILAFDSKLREYGVNGASYLIMPNYLETYAELHKQLYDMGDEVALHGTVQQDPNFASSLDTYLYNMYIHGYEPKGFVESATMITPENLILARNYFQWVIKNGGDYNAFDITDVSDCINILSDNPYEMKRLAIEMYHTDHADSAKVANVINKTKEAIDETISSKGLLVLYTHSYNLIDGTTYTLYPDVLEPILTYLRARLQTGKIVTGRTDEIVEYYYSKRYNEQ